MHQPLYSFVIYDFLWFFMIFYDFSSNIQTGIRNIKWPLKGVFRVYILLLTSLLHSFTHEACSSSCTFSLVFSLELPITFWNSFSIWVCVCTIISELLVCTTKRYFAPFFVKYTWKAHQQKPSPEKNGKNQEKTYFYGTFSPFTIFYDFW